MQRLQGLLPLERGQNAYGAQVRELHRNILRSFVIRGRILTRNEMAQHVSKLEDAVKVLGDRGMVIFSGEGDPVGAYPFTMEAREHRVRINGYQVYAMCALDALAISPMFGMQTQIDSCCRITGAPVTIRQSGKTIENPDEAGALHFGIDWGAADADASCADSLCLEMMFLRNSDVGRRWLGEDSRNREIFTLPEAVDFAGRFFLPLVS